MPTYDLCLAWSWTYDEDFVRLLEEACQLQGITLWQVTPPNLLEAVRQLHSQQAMFHTLLDRAADDLRFEPIRRFAASRRLHRLNPAEVSRWAEDKATMHLELIQAGVQTPYTILMAPFIDQPILPPLDLTPLGGKFVIKPAVGGGGEGVTMNASGLDEIQRARLEFPAQKYLAQAYIEPRLLAGRQAWFRAFYTAGDCLLCWWNPSTHIYAVLAAEQEVEFDLQPLREVTRQIAAVCKLDWFSTEIALTGDGKFVVVDYVNDGIDLRIQSKARDGVPNEILRRMASKLASLAKAPSQI